MRYLLPLLFTLSASTAELHNQLEADIFGTSYHFNRSKDWNETNPGVGVGLILTKQKEDPGFHASFTIQTGVYKDSYNDTAFFLVAGPRLTLGQEDSLHACAELGLGYVHGSGNNGTAIIPTISAGYDRCSLCVTADPTGGAVAAFLRFRLMDF